MPQHENNVSLQEANDDEDMAPHRFLKIVLLVAMVTMVILGSALLRVAWRTSCMHGSAGGSASLGGQQTAEYTVITNPVARWTGQSLSARDTQQHTRARASVSCSLPSTRPSMMMRVQLLGTFLAATLGGALRCVAARLENIAQSGTPKVRDFCYVV